MVSFTCRFTREHLIDRTFRRRHSTGGLLAIRLLERISTSEDMKGLHPNYALGYDPAVTVPSRRPRYPSLCRAGERAGSPVRLALESLS